MGTVEFGRECRETAMQPQIFSWEIRGRTAYVKCSPMSRIIIIAGGASGSGAEFIADSEDDCVTSAKWQLHGGEESIHVVCTDKNGRTIKGKTIYLN